MTKDRDFEPSYKVERHGVKGSVFVLYYYRGWRTLTNSYFTHLYILSNPLTVHMSFRDTQSITVRTHGAGVGSLELKEFISLSRKQEKPRSNFEISFRPCNFPFFDSFLNRGINCP